MTELGQTVDPKELIPGEVELISNALRDLVGNIEAVGITGEGLGRVDPGSWVGDAALAFREAFAAEQPQWFSAVDKFNANGETLADYAEALARGQSEALRAIELYLQAQAASRAAAAQYVAQAQSAAAAGEALAPFNDPGETLAQEAQAILDDARGAVALAGDMAARKLGFTPDGEGGYEKNLGSTEWGASRRDRTRWDPETKQWVDQGGWQQHGGGRSWTGQRGTQSNGMMHDLVSDALGRFGIDIPEQSWNAAANIDLLEGSEDGQFSSGAWSGKGKFEWSLLGAGADVHTSASALGVEASANAEAHLAEGGAEGELNYGEHASISGSAEASVGAEASAGGAVGVSGAEVNLGVFAGAQAGLETSAELGGVNAGVHGDVRFGVGAEVSGQFGMGDDGRFHIGGSASLTLGVGGSVGFDLAIDAEVVDTVTDVVDDVGDVASSIGGGVVDAAESVGNFFGDL